MRHFDLPSEPIDVSDLEGIPFKHLGSDRSGIDCFSLGVLLYKEKLGITIPYVTADFTEADTDEHWYTKTVNPTILTKCFNETYGWKIVERARPFDFVLMSIGSTNAANHCGVLLQDGTMFHVMMGYSSHKIRYGNIFKQATVKIGRWNLDYERHF